MANYQSYSDYYSLFGEDPTRMSYRTFPEYLLSATKEDEEGLPPLSYRFFNCY